MDPDPTSLENLRDIVVPPDVSWWPLATGWYLVSGLFLMVVMILLISLMLRLRKQAYRRAGIKAVLEADSVQQISSILRRVALISYSREEVAALSGETWAEWLGLRANVSMSSRVRQQLATGAYQVADPHEDVIELKSFAAGWIRHHATKTALPASRQADLHQGAASC